VQVIVDLAAGGDRITIGRRPTNDVVLDWDSEISRVHAALERLGDAWTVVDDGLSRNGSYLNGDRVTSRRRLRDGDVLTVGGVALAFRTPGGESVSRPTVTALGPHVGESLTPAQRRALVALCRPFKDSSYATPATNQQIADELVVSVDAVKSTLRALFELFGVDALPQNQKRASLALQAMRTGVITRRDL
jgi:pSer/pThr/pTyr-binding forkhead associated (FHA) protein